jgi:hypothetical protein
VGGEAAEPQAVRDDEDRVRGRPGEGGCVVDAVSDHGHDAALGLEAPDDLCLLGRDHLSDDLVDANLASDRAGCVLVVAGGVELRSCP